MMLLAIKVSNLLDTLEEGHGAAISFGKSFTEKKRKEKEKQVKRFFDEFQNVLGVDKVLIEYFIDYFD